jgi:hypothetical protein
MTRFTLAVAAVVAGLSGCASPAHYVEQNHKEGTGVVAIPEPTDIFPTYYMSEAKALIQRHVGPNYEIVEGRKHEIGQRTFNDQKVNNEETWNTTNPLMPASRQTMQNTTTTQPVTEWRIWYRKKPTTLGAQPAPQQPGSTIPPVQPAAHTPAPGVGAGTTPALGVQPAAGQSVYPAPGAQFGGAPQVAPAGGPLAPVSPVGVIPAGPLAPTNPNGGTVYGQAGIVVGSMR